MIYMLDTNICGYIIRNKPEHLREKLKKADTEGTLALSAVVVSELLYGAMKKKSDKLLDIVLMFISNFTIFDFDRDAASEYAGIRASLEFSGKLIGANDLFIAAHAKSLDALLITNNTKEFKRVNGLKIENWV
ncbi:MAG: type II toxin-antitoxin system VapC family toxin [Flexistipes sinusarabici]|uniref:Ribonuclease VapC n=2 Tax=Flexistipes sinusarabici TaxID=2352 RepID=A0A5D0MN35_FLESI|nr:MAG: type II toxin-antitoxin system VapC family toxin [Flexistipes sinusarabici]